MNKVKICEESGCWIWTASLTKTGYGTFVPVDAKSGLAHRESYKIFKGKISDDMGILHICHNRRCVNPEHLKQGTPMDNTVDRILARRPTVGHKFDHDEVDEIILMRLNGSTYMDICDRFDCSKSYLYQLFRKTGVKYVRLHRKHSPSD